MLENNDLQDGNEFHENEVTFVEKEDLQPYREKLI